MKINDLINPFEFTGYLITSDEYVRDYMVLSDEFSSCLFKLRLGYAMKASHFRYCDCQILQKGQRIAD